jgi:hypothetical protein
VTVFKESFAWNQEEALATRVTLVDSAGAALAPGSTSSTSSTGATTSVAASASAVTLKAANADRRGLTVYNDSTDTLYVLLGAGTVSATVFTVQMATETYYEVPFGFTGIVTGIWSGTNGAARITEVTA